MAEPTLFAAGSSTGRPLPALVILNDAARIAGGADRVACESAIGLAGRGYRVRFLCADPEIAPEMMAAGIDVRPLPLVSAYERPSKGEQLRALSGNPDTPPLVRGALEGLEPGRTIVHVHNDGLRMTWTAIRACQEWGAPTVFTAHDYGSACPTSNFFDYPAERPCPRRPLGASCLRYECTGQGHKARLPRVLSAAAMARAGVHRKHAAVLHVSAMAERILRPYLRGVGHQEVLPNPQELVAGDPVTPSRSDAFLYVGRLVPEKGVGVFLQAARAAGVRARIVGDGRDRERLEREFPEAEFVGWLAPEAVAGEFARARAHVFPSLWRETLGLSVLDAASIGVPTIASEIVGAAEWMTAHDAGLTFPAGDSGALATALTELSVDARVDALGARAHAALWADPPSLDRHLDALERIYALVDGGRIRSA